MTPRGLLYNNPMAAASIDHAIATAPLGPDDLVLDVGCGRGEVLARVLEFHGCRGIGIDQKPDEIAAARVRMSNMGDRVTLHVMDANDFDPGDAAIRLAICVGSTHVYGGPGVAYGRTLRSLAALTTPGGFLLVGEGYWRRPPVPEYLAATGMGPEDFASHAANVTLAEEQGLVPLSATAASEADWDRFESCFWRAAELALQDTPGDEAVRERAEHWRRWRHAYLAWGRETLGFGLYVFQTSVNGA